MAENFRASSLSAKAPFYQLITAIVIILVAGGVIFVLLTIAGVVIFSPEIDFIKDPDFLTGNKSISFLRYMLIIQHISLFIIPGVYLFYQLRPIETNVYFDTKKPVLVEIYYVIILAFCIFPVTGFTGDFNSGLNLPEWLSDLEDWMRSKEDYAEKLMEAVLKPGDSGSLLINIVMIAVLPAVGEELIFRGVIQKILKTLFRSGHLSVLVTAFIFSAIHFQFYGFLPRFILGLVFGYLFLWSGTLWLPVIAHFINNGVLLLVVYFQEPDISYIQNDLPLYGQIAALTGSVLIGSLILNYFRKKAVSFFL